MLECIDQNECTSEVHDCPVNAACNNNVGSYTCTCNPGYEDINGDGRTCTDINECENQSDPCNQVEFNILRVNVKCQLGLNLNSVA